MMYKRSSRGEVKVRTSNEVYIRARALVLKAMYLFRFCCYMD